MQAAPPPPALLADPMSPLHIFFGLRGRIPRKIFWIYGVLVPLGLGLYLNLLLGIAGVRQEAVEGVLNLAVLWSAVAVSAKRWHDRDKSGWWVLIQLVPVVGLLWTLVENGLLRGTAGPNRFGADLTQHF